MKKNFGDFLKSKITDSIETLMKKLSEKMETMKKLDVGITSMIVAAVNVGKVMGMGEEVKLLGYLVTLRFALSGIEVPENIAKLFASVETATLPNINECGEFVRPKPAPVVAQPASAIASVPAPKPAVVKTTPARGITGEKQFSLENTKKTWLGQLGGIARSGKAPWPTVQATGVKLFRVGVQLTSEEWQTLFSAMKKATEQGRYILPSEAVRTNGFRSAPDGLLLEYIFGQDGALIALSADLHELKGEMPAWLVAKTHVTLDLIDVLDQNLASGIGEQEVARVEKLEALLKSKKAPDSLLTKIEVILGGEVPQGPTNPPRIVGDLNSVVKKSAGKTFVGVDPTPATDFALPERELVLQ